MVNRKLLEMFGTDRNVAELCRFTYTDISV